MLNDFVLLVDARVAHGLLDLDPRTEAYSYLDRGRCPVPDIRRSSHLTSTIPASFQAQPFDAGTLLSLSIESFAYHTRRSPSILGTMNMLFDRQINGGTFERRTERQLAQRAYWHALRPANIPELLISDAGSTRGFGKHCCRITRGRVFPLDAMVRRCFSGKFVPYATRINFSPETYDRSIGRLGQEVLRDSRDTPALRIMVSLTLTAVPIFVIQLVLGKPRLLLAIAFYLSLDRSQVSALGKDVQRQTLGGTPAPRILLG